MNKNFHLPYPLIYNRLKIIWKGKVHFTMNEIKEAEIQIIKRIIKKMRYANFH